MTNYEKIKAMSIEEMAKFFNPIEKWWLEWEVEA